MRMKMRINRTALLIGFAITTIMFWEIAAHAEALDQSTKVTFAQPVQIPGQILPAGTYLFKLTDPNDQNLVQIFNSDGTRLYATLRAISTERPEPTGKTVVTVAEPGGGRPDALLKWFYPGNTIGHEFVYSQHEEQ